ncbi:MAG: DUF1858 domain-containing protein [Bacteroidota bacterium]
MPITADSVVEELVTTYAGIVGFLGEKGLRCIVCGETVWGTVGDVARDKGFTPEQIDNLVEELNSKFNKPYWR